MIFKDLGLIYLATPYSKYKKGLDAAFEDAAKLTGRMLKEGANVYSPIVHTHPIAKLCDMPTDAAFWLPFDEAMLDVSKTLVIAKMDGWWDSTGIKEEFKFFYNRVKPIYYMNPDTLELFRGTDY